MGWGAAGVGCAAGGGGDACVRACGVRACVQECVRGAGIGAHEYSCSQGPLEQVAMSVVGCVPVWLEHDPDQEVITPTNL